MLEVHSYYRSKGLKVSAYGKVFKLINTRKQVTKPMIALQCGKEVTIFLFSLSNPLATM